MYMARLIVRKLDDDLVRQLKIRAARNNRSAEAEHRAILEATLRPREEGFWRRAEAFRAATRGRQTTDSTVPVRRDRDRRAETDARLRHRR
jgi:plasmid stability protein